MSNGDANDEGSAKGADDSSEREHAVDEPTVSESPAAEETQSPQQTAAEAAGPGSRAEPGAIGDAGVLVPAGPPAGQAGDVARLHGEMAVRGSKRVARSPIHEGRFGRMFRRLPPMAPLSWTYSYEPFGTTRTETSNGGSANFMKFTGEYLDQTGLYHLRARQYDPSQGRFLVTDPVRLSLSEPGVSAFAYVANRPTYLVDPSGMVFLPSEDAQLSAQSPTSTAHVEVQAFRLHSGQPPDEWYGGRAYLWVALYERGANFTYTIAANSLRDVEWDVRVNSFEWERGRFNATEKGNAASRTVPCIRGEWVVYADAPRADHPVSQRRTFECSGSGARNPIEIPALNPDIVTGVGVIGLILVLGAGGAILEQPL